MLQSTAHLERCELVEVIDYASAKKPDMLLGTAPELAEALADVKREPSARPVAELSGIRETRGAAVRLPSM